MKTKTAFFLIGQYFIVVFLLMILYHGGNYFEHSIDHFVFYKNYLSDLGRTRYFNQSVNPYWYFYSITLALVSIGVFLFFWEMSKTLSKYKKRIVLFFALLSSAGFFGIAVFPVDIAFEEHILAGSIAFFSFFIAFLFLFLFRLKSNTKTQQILFGILIILWLLFLAIKFLAPPSQASVNALILKVMAQKTIVFSQLIIAVFLLRKESESRKKGD